MTRDFPHIFVAVSLFREKSTCAGSHVRLQVDPTGDGFGPDGSKRRLKSYFKFCYCCLTINVDPSKGSSRPSVTRFVADLFRVDRLKGCDLGYVHVQKYQELNVSSLMLDLQRYV